MSRPYLMQIDKSRPEKVAERSLGFMEWAVILMGVVAVCMAIYLQTLRHP